MKLQDLVGEEDIYFITNLYEMSNFGSNKTGLENGSVLWVRTDPGELPHVKFRFKLVHPQHGSAVFGFWGNSVQQLAGNWKITGKPLQAINNFATLNKDALFSHINGETDSGDLLTTLLKNKPNI